MSSPDDSLERLFEQALLREDPLEREQWLQSVLGNDPDKLQEVRDLIANDEESDWMDKPRRIVKEMSKLIEDMRGKQVGAFLLVEKIGSGGMGDVYLAKQLVPVRRYVAVKLIFRDAEHQQIIERFQREKQMLANMEHPNIARIIDAGTTDTGLSYIAMEYVKGHVIVEYCKLNRLDIRARLELHLQCCRAIQHAHQRGIIHRDIKPSNVMVTLVDSEPMVKVIDFGIAKAALSDSVRTDNEYTSSIVSMMSMSITSHGISPGTPPYMSPEQFPKSGLEIDTRSDIYSLGALLYAMLTDQNPFDDAQLTDKSLEEIGELIGNRDPLLPSQRVPQLAGVLRGDLDSIVRKAMSRDVEKRYQSVAQFSEDLRHYLNGEPVSTNPGNSWTQFRRLARRNQLLIGAAAVAFTGVLIGWFVAVDGAKEATRQRVVSSLFAASMSVQNREYDLGSATLRGISGDKSLSGGAANERLDYRLLRSQIPDLPVVFETVQSKIYFGLTIESRNAIACGCQDSTFQIFDLREGGLIWRKQTDQKEINGLAVSPDGKILASAGDDGTIKFWDLDQRTMLTEIKASEKSVFQVAWSSDGLFLITGADEPKAKVWSYPSGELIRELHSLSGDLECVALSQDGVFAFGDESGRVTIGKLQSTSSKKLFSQHKKCSCVSFSKSGRLLAIGLNQGYLSLLLRSDEGYEPIEQIKFPYDVTSVAFSGDERRLAIGESSGALHVLQLQDDWLKETRLKFTDSFYVKHSDLFDGVDDKAKRLQSLIERIDPPNALDSLPPNSNRITIEFKEELRNTVYRDQFKRQWLEPTGDATGDRFDAPLHIIQKGKSLELIFLDRRYSWADPETLQKELRLDSWAAHKSRIASLAWGAHDLDLFSFSEDATIRKLSLPGRREYLFGADTSDLYPLSSSHFFFLNKDLNRLLRLNWDTKDVHPTVVVPTEEQGREIVHVVRAVGSVDLARFSKSDASGAVWTIERLGGDDTSTIQSLAQIPKEYRFEHLIGSLSGNRWVGRFSHSQDQRVLRERPVFLGLWDPTRSDFVWRHQESTEPFRQVDMDSDKEYLVYEKNATIFMVNLSTGVESQIVKEPNLSVGSMKISPDGKFLAVALSKDRLIRCYRIQGAMAKKVWDIPQNGGPITDLEWSNDQAILTAVSQDGHLRAYDIETGRLSAQIALKIGVPKWMRISPDEQAIFVLDESGSILRLPCPRSSKH